jgi:hypothetical protein
MKGEKTGPRQADDRHPLAGDKAVASWRRQQLLAMGFTLADSRRIAASPAELAAVRTLVGHGCPLETAKRIVL